MDLSAILTKAVTSSDGDCWGFTRVSDDSSSTEGKVTEQFLVRL